MTVLRVHAGTAVVTVAAIGAVGRVVAVLGLVDDDGAPRNRESKLTILLEERSAEIVRSAIGKWIPLIAPPNLRIVNRIGRVRLMNRDDTLSGEIALPVVDRSLIAECHSPLAPAGGAE